jgi:ubiquinone/menaquinone biosynthesis C-methylase UbiE
MSRTEPGRDPFEEPEIASRYESWYQREGRRADRLEKRLLAGLLGELRSPRSLLEVGCGTGHFTRWLRRSGGLVVGLDRSLEMLRQAPPAERRWCVRGDASALPFPNGSFDTVAFITTLEFVSDPGRALEEAFRVARRGVLVGALNRHSLLGRRLRRRGGPIWSSARFFTIHELRQLVAAASGGREPRVVTRTTLWPLWPGALALPWGGFIGLVAVASPRNRGELEP